MNYIECPYCEANCAEPEESIAYNEILRWHCHECDRTFVYTAELSVYYTSEKAECLNGGAHDWKQIIGCPIEYFAKRRRCSMCNEEILLCGGEQQ